MGIKRGVVAAHEAGQRDAAGLRQANGQPRRCRDRRQNRATGRSGFLHHLEARAAGYQEGTGAGGRAFAGQRADQFIERVVPADVFAHGMERALCRDPCRRMRGTGGTVQGLRAAHGVHAGQQVGQPHDGLGGDRRHGAQDFRQRFHTAQPASGAARQGPPTVLQPGHAGTGDLDVDHHAVFTYVERDIAHIARGVHDAFRQRKAHRKVLEIRGRSEHRGVADAVVGQGDGRFLGQHILLGCGHALPTADAHHLGGNTVGGQAVEIGSEVCMPQFTFP